MADGADTKYWEDGFPYPYLASPDDDLGTNKFWFEGFTYAPLDTASTPPAADTTAMFMMFF